MSVNIEGNVGQTSAASGWYQNGRAVSAQEKEKDAPQPKADNAVKVSISREGIESYRKQTREKGISGRATRTAQGSVMWRMKIQRRVSAK